MNSSALCKLLLKSESWKVRHAEWLLAVKPKERLTMPAFTARCLAHTILHSDKDLLHDVDIMQVLRMRKTADAFITEALEKKYPAHKKLVTSR